MAKKPKHRKTSGRPYIDAAMVERLRAAVLAGLDDESAAARCRVSPCVAAAVRCSLTCERCGRLDARVRPHGESAYLCPFCRRPELRLPALAGLGLDLADEVLR